MKLLINLCAHDGIVSHYAGVGTIVKRYIEAFQYILNTKRIDYDFYLYTPEYNEDSFGYSESTYKMHKNLKIFQVPNGTCGELAYGTPNNWKILSYNTASIINKINIDEYDIAITIANDTPYADMLRMLNKNKKHIKIWIPHSTGKIHLIDSSIKNSEEFLNDRLKWEENAVNFINNNENCYLGVTGRYIGKHLVDEYNLNEEKQVDIINGEILSHPTEYFEDDLTIELFNKIKNYDEIILSFGRAEKYKNLDATMEIGKRIGMQSVVLAQGYYKGQPLVEELKGKAIENNAIIFVNPPFYLAQYIVKNFNKNMILLIPSKKEIVGLIINEIRKLNKDNVLIVANDIGGMHEQINDGIDGVLVDLNNLDVASEKIKMYFNNKTMKKMNEMSQKRLQEEYDFEKICEKFIFKFLRENKVI